jgi:hypothetical protein
MKKLKNILKMLGGALLAILVGGAIGIAISEIHSESQVDGVLFPLELVAAMIISFYLSVIVHEGGHLVFGLISGYRFSSFRVGSLMLMRSEGKFSLRSFSLAGTGGQCLMCPPNPVEGSVPVVLYNLGGVIFNMIFSVISMVLYFLYRDIPFLSPTLLVFGIISVIIVLTNGIPLYTGGIANDGMNALSLAKDRRAAVAFLNQLRMNEAQTRGIRLCDMPAEWFHIPNDADMRNVTFATTGVFRANRTMDSGDTITAEREINALLHSGWNIIDLYKNLLVCDLICCRLINGTDTDVSSLITPELTKVMKAMKRFPSIMRTEYAIARLVDKNDSEAAKIMKRFETVAKKYPYTADLESERKVMEKIDVKAGQNVQ